MTTYSIAQVRAAVARGVFQAQSSVLEILVEAVTAEVWTLLNSPEGRIIPECPYKQCHHCSEEGCLHVR